MENFKQAAKYFKMKMKTKIKQMYILPIMLEGWRLYYHTSQAVGPILTLVELFLVYIWIRRSESRPKDI